MTHLKVIWDVITDLGTWRRRPCVGTKFRKCDITEDQKSSGMWCDVTSTIKLLRTFRRLGLLDADKTTLQTYEKRDKLRLRILWFSAFVKFRCRVSRVGKKNTQMVSLPDEPADFETFSPYWSLSEKQEDCGEWLLGLQCVGSHVDIVLRLSHEEFQRNFLLPLTSCEL